MKVVHIFNEIKYSGAEIMYYDAIDVFNNLGVDICFVATAGNIGNFAEKFTDKGLKVYHKPYPARLNYIQRIIYYLSFIRFIKKEKIDIVHNHSSKTFWDMSLCAQIAGITSVHTFHNVFRPHWYSYLYHLGLRAMAKYFFKCRFQSISDSVYENELRFYKNRTTKIFNWINTNRFYPGTEVEKNNIRKELKIADKAFVLISVGECSEIKRHSDIIKALAEIKKTIPEVLYIHLGNGKLLDKEKALARKSGVTNCILFIENQLDVRKFMIASDVYIMTSKFEGISLTTIEAMACKVPAVLYNVPGLRDFNKYKNNSLLIPEKPELIAKSVIEIYNSDIRTEEIVKQAYLNVELNYSMNTNAKEIFQLYL